MIFKIIWDKKAIDELEKLELLISRRIILKVKELAEDPFSKNIKKLRGEHIITFVNSNFPVSFSSYCYKRNSWIFFICSKLGWVQSP